MNHDYQNFLVEVIGTLLKPMGIDPEFLIEKESDQYRVTIKDKANKISTDPNFLFSLQHITRVLVHHNYPEEKGHFLLDIGGAKKTREKLISERIPVLTQEIVLSKGSTIILVGLTGYERKLVHGILTEVKGLQTTSVGSPENRKLLIMPTSESSNSGIENAKVVNLFSD